MRKLLTVLILLVTVAHVAAQQSTARPMCDTKEKVFKMLADDFGEIPQWMGHIPQSDTHMMLTVNSRTGTWTVIEYNTVTACVISSGNRSISGWGTPI